MPKKTDKKIDNTRKSPFETDELRKGLRKFLQETLYHDPSGTERAIGSYKWGVYAFYDYDGEPIYVGQTKEKVSGRIGRHLTNQRTDAVAMSVLDPFEVAEIEVWPLPEFEAVGKKNPKFKMANAHLNALEHLVFTRLRSESKFKAILNEKDPPVPTVEINEPPSVRGSIISEQIQKLRGHPDTRLARRALIISKLSQVIAERAVKMGLRRVLVTQTKRMHWLANNRFENLGGESLVEKGTEGDEGEPSDE